MSPKPFEYGIVTKNTLVPEIRLRDSQRTILLGTIAKIESVSSDLLFSVKFLKSDELAWESNRFLVQKNVIVEIPKDIWMFLASVHSPQERVKLSKDREKLQHILSVHVGSIVGYKCFTEETVLATVMHLGKISAFGMGYGLKLHKRNPKSHCDGTQNGISYFKCVPGCGVFTTIDHLTPYGNLTLPKEQTSNGDLNCLLKQNLESFSITNGNGCDTKTSNKGVTKSKETVAIDMQSRERPPSNKLCNQNKVSLPSIEVIEKTSNQNNDFDHNTIIQPDNIHLMNQDLKCVNKDQKHELDLVDFIGTDWSSNSNTRRLESYGTLRRHKDKSQSVFYTDCPDPAYINDTSTTRDKNAHSNNYLVNSKTVPRYTRTSSSVLKDFEGMLKDRKQEINRSNCEEKVAPVITYTTPPPGTTNDLTIGSMVEILNDVSELPLYGVVRWLGVESSKHEVLVGIELEDDEHTHLPLTLTDGTHNGQRHFKCSKNRGIFVPLCQCRKDSRFSDGTSLVLQNALEEPLVKEVDCPVIEGSVPPLCMPTEEDVKAVCGKFRGIQGHHNSCYLDATLFAMFTFTSVFDTLLYRPKGQDDIACYDKVQQVLRDEIVNPLRTNLFVRADKIMNLRKLLDQLSSVSGLTTEEKDPEEFLHSLLAQILKAEPFLKLSSGQEAYHYQLFLEKDDLTLPSVQQLFEQSFLVSNIKLKEVPSCLIIQMPRFGKNYKMYPRIIPSQLLDVTDVIESCPRQCTVCGNLAIWECTQCFGQCGEGLESTAFCMPCLEKAHTHNKRSTHSPKKLSVSQDFSIMADHCTPPRLFMELFAVICIETSHYVAFVKCGVGQGAPWCFFDSMADRQGGQNGYNIPEMSACPDVSKWLSDEQSCKLLHENAPSDKYLPEYARRLLCDAYICMYQSPDVMMYR